MPVPMSVPSTPRAPHVRGLHHATWNPARGNRPWSPSRVRMGGDVSPRLSAGSCECDSVCGGLFIAKAIGWDRTWQHLGPPACMGSEGAPLPPYRWRAAWPAPLVAVWTDNLSVPGSRRRLGPGSPLTPAGLGELLLHEDQSFLGEGGGLEGHGRIGAVPAGSAGGPGLMPAHRPRRRLCPAGLEPTAVCSQAPFLPRPRRPLPVSKPPNLEGPTPGGSAVGLWAGLSLRPKPSPEQPFS